MGIPGPLTHSEAFSISFFFFSVHKYGFNPSLPWVDCSDSSPLLRAGKRKISGRANVRSHHRSLQPIGLPLRVHQQRPTTLPHIDWLQRRGVLVDVRPLEKTV